jgi:hypothetical protein
MPATKSPNGVHRLAKRPSRLSSSPAGAERPPTSSAPPFVNGKNNGRDDQGRFTPGHAGGPGRPMAAPANAFSRQLAENRCAFVGVLGPAQVAAIAQKILERALAGDMTAAKLALTFAVGKPAPVPDPDAQDVEELHLYQKAAEATAVLPAAVQALPADLACGMVQAARPAVRDQMADVMVAALTAPDAAAADAVLDAVDPELQQYAAEAPEETAAPDSEREAPPPAAPKPKSRGKKRGRRRGAASTENKPLKASATSQKRPTVRRADVSRSPHRNAAASGPRRPPG